MTFEKSADAKPYCEAAAAQQKGNGKVAEAGFTPAAFRTYVTSDQFLGALDAQDATAPRGSPPMSRPTTSGSESTSSTCSRGTGTTTASSCAKASAEELAEFNYFDPAVEEHDSRVSAYVQQVCGIE